MVSADGGDAVIVYGTPDDNSAFFLPRNVALEQAAISIALSSVTWGEIRANSSPELYLSVLRTAGYDDVDLHSEEETAAGAASPDPGRRPLPKDEDPFDPDREIPGYADGDFPPDPRLLMFDLLPAEVVLLGQVYERVFNGTFVNGTFVRFRPNQVDQVVGLLSRLGYRCEEDQELITTVLGLRWIL